VYDTATTGLLFETRVNLLRLSTFLCKWLAGFTLLITVFNYLSLFLFFYADPSWRYDAALKASMQISCRESAVAIAAG